MIRTLRHLLLIFTLFGLAGQATAMAMVAPRPVTWTDPAPEMSGMDCASTTMADHKPCKSMTWQCIVAMGCATAALVEPSAMIAVAPATADTMHAPARVAPLPGRSYGPEPDPPSRLI